MLYNLNPEYVLFLDIETVQQYADYHELPGGDVYVPITGRNSIIRLLHAAH
jgi:hypothetical protein